MSMQVGQECKNVKRVMELLDVEILLSQVETEDRKQLYTLYGLGSPAEMNAGLRRMEVTPFYKTMSELEEYCKKYLKHVPIGINDIPEGLIHEWKKVRSKSNPKKSKAGSYVFREVELQRIAKELLEVLKRLDKCENHAQTCFVFDSLTDEIKEMLYSIE